MRNKEIENLNKLSLEERARKTEKAIPCGLSIAILGIGLSLGLYYWFYDEIGFSYYDVAPFWGFIIYTLTSFGILIPIAWVNDLYWSEYNKSIRTAIEQIEDIIKSGNCDQSTLRRLKTFCIERKIAKSCLTQEEFDWHSSIYCWGCGKVHTHPPIPYKVHKKRTKTWKDGAIRYTKTFQKTAYINLCPNCYNRLIKSDSIYRSNSNLIDKIFWALAIIITLSFPILYLIDTDELTWDVIVSGGFCLIILFGLTVSLGRIVLYPIAILIALPFWKKGSNFKTKWSFNEIPSIRKFYNSDLTH